jgi:hypothetical protein
MLTSNLDSSVGKCYTKLGSWLDVGLTGFHKPVTPEEKRATVAAVLASQTFDRSALAKRVLSYLCTQEIEGHREAITEYLIGVHALGRDTDFSPGEDAAVRSHVHSVRKKLQEYYLGEALDAELRIELPKGTCTPQYIRGRAGGMGPIASVAEALQFHPRKRKAVRWLAFLGIVALPLASGYVFRRPVVAAMIRAGIPAVIREAWGPLVEGEGDEVLVVLATPPQFFLRDYRGVPPPPEPAWVPEIEQTPDVLSFYGQRQGLSPDTKLRLQPNQSSPLWGDAAAAISAVTTLTSYQVRCQTVLERLVKPYVLQGRNVLLFGRTEYSPTARLLLEKTPFAIEYEPKVLSWVVRNRSPRTGEPPFYQPGVKEGEPQEAYGVLTVLPNDSQAGGRRRIVVFSGITAGGTTAAEKFFSSPENLAELQANFRRDGLTRWPRGWQAVLKAQLAQDANLIMSFGLETYRVLEK